MKRIVVSGAGGFLGRNIIEEANNQRIPVLAITTRADLFHGIDTVSTSDFLAGNIKLLESDIFVNCVFPTNADGIKMANGLKTVYSIIISAKESGVGAFVNISSQSVYSSKRERPADENTQLSLETPYAVGKYSSEEFTNVVFKNQPHTNIRIASLLGVSYEQRIVNRMITKALSGEKLNIIGGMQRYGFLDVRDASTGLIAICKSNPLKWREIYNLGVMSNYTLINVANEIVEILNDVGYQAEYIVTEGEDYRNSSLDASLFMEEFNWAPRYELRQTVLDIIKYKVDGLGV